jgi:4-hydroxybenzoate polyprenyltransferase
MIAALLAICRPYYAVPMSLAYALTLYYALGGRMAGEWAGAAVSAAALALVIAAGYVLNDVCDLAADRVNAPWRPIAAGRISRRAAAAWGALLLACGLGLATAARLEFLASLAVVAAGLVLYDLVSKRLGVGKQLLVAALMTSLYPLAIAQAGGASGPRAAALAPFAAWMFMTAFGYEVLKDIRDIPGDRAGGGPVTQVQRRPRLWRTMAGGTLLAAALLLVAPVFLGCGWVYMAVASAAMAAAIVSLFLPVRRAIMAVYAECFLVGVAATLDPLILGF